MVACNQFAAFLLVGEMGSELVRLSHNSQRERRTLSLSLSLSLSLTHSRGSMRSHGQFRKLGLEPIQPENRIPSTGMQAQGEEQGMASKMPMREFVRTWEGVRYL